MSGENKIFRAGWAVYIFLLCTVLTVDTLGQSGVILPCQVSGTVKYNNRLVSDGHKVVAFIQGVKYAETEVKNGGYTLLIPADDPSTLEKEGWSQNEYVSLKVEGYSGVILFKVSSTSLKVDINLITMGVLNLTTWGKIKALFK